MANRGGKGGLQKEEGGIRANSIYTKHAKGAKAESSDFLLQNHVIYRVGDETPALVIFATFVVKPHRNGRRERSE